MDNNQQQIINVLKELGNPKKLASIIEAWEICNSLYIYIIFT